MTVIWCGNGNHNEQYFVYSRYRAETARRHSNSTVRGEEHVDEVDTRAGGRKGWREFEQQSVGGSTPPPLLPQPRYCRP